MWHSVQSGAFGHSQDCADANGRRDRCPAARPTFWNQRSSAVPRPVVVLVADVVPVGVVATPVAVPVVPVVAVPVAVVTVVVVAVPAPVVAAAVVRPVVVV